MNVVVTGGGTIAPLDDVRHLANFSTGRFSAEISEACLRRGARVWHIHAEGAMLPFHRLAMMDLDAASPEVEVARLLENRRQYGAVKDRLHLRPLEVGTVSDYSQVLRAAFDEAPIDIVFLAMAVSDFEPEPTSGKIRSVVETLDLRLRRTPKVIRSVRDWAPDVYLVGFKLLSGSSQAELISEAIASCEENRADLVVANDLRTVKAGDRIVHLARPDRSAVTIGPGGSVADDLVDHAIEWSSERTRIEYRP